MIKPITAKTLADATGLSVKTVRRLERRGLIRAVRDYRGWRQFAPTEVERLRELLGWTVLDRPAPLSATKPPNKRGST